ncbi:unnamed protein product [Brassicogethes aeneus]|uniref:Uncharacterized protein n=1 Tax=Brassicogethes aeneus TaxID=1431903 RepID=A0A9P0B1J7_BRAAE|nr:unnamed protein product [Brassicogethes aeneus]
MLSGTLLRSLNKSSVMLRNCSSGSNDLKSLLITKMGKVVTIGINRPSKRNCVDSKTANLLKGAIKEFEEDSSLHAGVLYGTGGNFCAGYDLNELANLDKVDYLNTINDEGSMGPTLRHIKKPMVAAISGYAVAGGLELALMCDLRVMEDTAILGVYNRRFGIPLVDGGTVRLQAMVGLSRTLDLILTGRSLTAKEALEWGVANRIVACGTALGQAISLATSLVKFPQECLQADRESTYNAAYNSAFRELSKFEQNTAKRIFKESIEGAKKFVSGFGRHGKSYNLTEKDICDWEREFKSKL